MSKDFLGLMAWICIIFLGSYALTQSGKSVVIVDDCRVIEESGE